MKKERGKAVAAEVYNNELFAEYSSSSSDLQCKKHPQSSSSSGGGGVCAYCLKERLLKLVCSDCGEQRLSSCSCSDISSNRNSCIDVGSVGSVGRVSFLIENDKTNTIDQVSNPKSKPKSSGGSNKVAEEVFLLKRSNSSCVEIKKKNGLWKIGRLFRKKKGKSVVDGCEEEKSDLWVVDYMGVSRSRSLCSFRGNNNNGFFGSEDGGDLMSCYNSGARSSISAARSSGVMFDQERRSGFSESEPRRSGFSSECEPRKSGVNVMEVDGGGGGVTNRRVFSLKESFTGGDEPGFIDLKFDSSVVESKGGEQFPKLDSKSVFGSMRVGDDGHQCCGGGGVIGDHHHHGILSHGGGGSCRITVNDRGIKKSRKSFKGWRWIFKHHPNWISGSRKKDEDFMVNP